MEINSRRSSILGFHHDFFTLAVSNKVTFLSSGECPKFMCLTLGPAGAFVSSRKIKSSCQSSVKIIEKLCRVQRLNF